jgi:hypothetical protein
MGIISLCSKMFLWRVRILYDILGTIIVYNDTLGIISLTTFPTVVHQLLRLIAAVVIMSDGGNGARDEPEAEAFVQ